MATILRNIHFKELKKKKHFPSVNLDDISYKLEDYKDFNYESMRKIVNGELQQALNKLDERYKTPLILSYMDGFSYKEIASILNTPMGTVMSRIARGKIFLKNELSKKTGLL